MTPPAKRSAPKPAASTAPELDVAAERAVLAVGAEDFLAERVTAAVVADARRADPSVERRDVDLGSETGLGNLVEACSPNLFGDAAVVVARNAEQADDAMVAALVEAAAAGDIRIVVLHPGGVKGRKVVDALSSGGFTVAPCEKARRRRLRRPRAAQRAAPSDARRRRGAARRDRG
jgi:DNA polymerase-3 subunit delta